MTSATAATARRRGSAIGTYRVGERAERASDERMVGALKLTRGVLAVLIALMVGIFVENYRWPNDFFVDGSWAAFGLSVLTVLACFGLVHYLRKAIRRRVRDNGSFLYLSCLAGDDYDRLRFERSVGDQVVGADLERGSRLFAGTIRLAPKLEPANPSASVDGLVDTFSHALKADDSSIPTNLLCNMLWPVAVEFGRRAEFEPDTRLWYLPERWNEPPEWFANYTWLGDDLLDVIDLADLRARFPHPIEEAGIFPDEPQAAANSGDEIVHLALSAQVPDDHSRDAYGDMLARKHLDDARVGPPLALYTAGQQIERTWFKDPGFMAEHAAKAASVIHHAAVRSDRVLVVARLAKPESVAIGYLLQHWKTLETAGARLRYAQFNPGARAYEVWDFD